jgi:hypothetical protein
MGQRLVPRKLAPASHTRQLTLGKLAVPIQHLVTVRHVHLGPRDLGASPPHPYVLGGTHKHQERTQLKGAPRMRERHMMCHVLTSGSIPIVTSPLPHLIEARPRLHRRHRPQPVHHHSLPTAPLVVAHSAVLPGLLPHAARSPRASWSRGCVAGWKRKRAVRPGCSQAGQSIVLNVQGKHPITKGIIRRGLREHPTTKRGASLSRELSMSMTRCVPSCF